MKVLLLLLAVLVTGCYRTWTIPADLDPIGPAGWEAEVELAAAIWNEGLATRDIEAPFSVVTGGDYPVYAVTPEEWPWPGANGVTFSGGSWEGDEFSDARIYVLASLEPDHRIHVLLHELGHAMGLTHRETGIMRWGSFGTELSDDDLDYAAQVLAGEPADP